MLRKWPVVVFSLFTALLVRTQTTTQPLGNCGIVGTVLNEEGQLVEQAKACTSITSGNHTGINCLFPTDKDGRFTVEHLKIGSYRVFAINEAEGYSIENQSPGQEVDLTADEPWATVTIRLRPRGDILIGSVRDRWSGKPVEGAYVNYNVIDNGGGGGSTRTNGNVCMRWDNGSSWVTGDGPGNSEPFGRLVFRKT